MSQWDQLADQSSIEKTVAALQQNGFQVLVAENGAEAKAKVLELLPVGAEVMTMTSMTLDTLGISQEIAESEKYDSVKRKLEKMDRATQGKEMQMLGAAPEWAIGSVHAVTEDGHLLISSNTGSQLPAYLYGAAHVIWVVGTQKIAQNDTEAMKRIYEYVLPLESERAKIAYGAPGSNVSKLAIYNKEVNPNRATVILVKEKLGY